MTEEMLMMAVKNGDLDKASALFEAYHKRIYNFLAKVSLDRELAHDLTQNVFLRMLKYRHTYKEGLAFQAWIFKIARNVFADHYSKKKVQYARYQDVEGLEGATQDEKTMAMEQEQALYAAMAKLGNEDREILVMGRFLKMKYEEIAKATGYTVANVKVKTHRAIKKLRKYYFELENA